MLGAPAGQRIRDGRVADVSNRPGDRGGGRLDRPQVYRNRDDGQGSVQQFLLAKVCKVHVSRRGRLTVRWRQMQSTESFQGCRSSGTRCGRSSPCRFATTSQVVTVKTLSIMTRKHINGDFVDTTFHPKYVVNMAGYHSSVAQRHSRQLTTSRRWTRCVCLGLMTLGREGEGREHEGYSP